METLRRAALAALLALPALAAPAFAADIRVEDAWARASLGQARNGAAYMIVHATGAQPDRLVAAASPVAGKVELHNHIMVGNVAQMRPVDAIEVVPGSPTVLQPGGLHVMLLDLTAPLQAGQKFPITLRFERAGEVRVDVDIRAVRPTPGHGHGGGHMHRN
ncbi:MAG: copper chaperone PCu(A)C [Tagaea sp.]|jgi:copper(I)-binding protein|nr:copper chaperone PCu(A)C [Azospirillum sp.]MCA3266258.1 copper chaperone PCu(A)C [Azospirillum sp.]